MQRIESDEWIIYESDEGHCRVYVRRDNSTKPAIENQYGKILELEIEKSLRDWERMRVEAAADMQKLR
jgi:hypothetical protein